MKTTAKQRVLAALQQGPQTTAALCQPDVGGVRFGARLLELRDEGHRITETRQRAGSHLYTLIVAVPTVGVLAGPEPSAPPAKGTARGAGRTGQQTTTGPWRRVWMCKSCAYAEVPAQRCPRGHKAVRGWTADFTRPALREAA